MLSEAFFWLRESGSRSFPCGPTFNFSSTCRLLLPDAWMRMQKSVHFGSQMRFPAFSGRNQRGLEICVELTIESMLTKLKRA